MEEKQRVEAKKVYLIIKKASEEIGDIVGRLRFLQDYQAKRLIMGGDDIEALSARTKLSRKGLKSYIHDVKLIAEEIEEELENTN